MNWRDPKNPSAGGAELVTYEIARRWAYQGNHVRLLTSNYPLGMPEVKLGDIFVSRVGGKYSVYIASAYRFLREYSSFYDVVIDQINSVPYLTPLYCRAPIVPLIFQMTRDVYYRQFPRPFSAMAAVIESLLLRFYSNCETIVLSNSTKKDLVSIGFSPDRIFVCPPGSDHEDFAPGNKTEEPSVLFLNRFSKYKNPDHLIVAFRDVLAEVPNCTLTLAGARSSVEISVLKDLVDKLGVSNRIQILPFVSGRAKLELLRRSWVHVLPSTREGWGISILEAAACGTPTVGYDVAGVRDAVQNLKTGLLVPYGSIASLAKAITTVLQDEHLRCSLAHNCWEESRQFTWDSTAENAMKAIVTAIEDKHRFLERSVLGYE